MFLNLEINCMNSSGKKTVSTKYDAQMNLRYYKIDYQQLLNVSYRRDPHQ